MGGVLGSLPAVDAGPREHPCEPHDARYATLTAAAELKLGGRISQGHAPQNRPPSGGRRPEGDKRTQKHKRKNKKMHETSAKHFLTSDFEQCFRLCGGARASFEKDA